MLEVEQLAAQLVVQLEEVGKPATTNLPSHPAEIPRNSPIIAILAVHLLHPVD